MRIVLDTDLAMGAPGSHIDDGFALAMAVADSDIELITVTTVNGNIEVDTATRLSSELLDRLGRSVPIRRGADRPLAAGAARNDATEAIIERVLADPGTVTVVAIGPLTNVALATRTEPKFVEALGGLVIMGGSFGDGRAEFNARSDPEAAEIVLGSGLISRWVGLNVTEQVRLTGRRAEQLAESDREFASYAGRHALGWIDQVSRDLPEGTEPSCALHDPLAIAALARPELLTWQPSHVQVDNAGVMSARPSVSEANAFVAVAVDAEGFLAYFEDLLARL
jgi:purine nucleosidase